MIQIYKAEKRPVSSAFYSLVSPMQGAKFSDTVHILHPLAGTSENWPENAEFLTNAAAIESLLSGEAEGFQVSITLQNRKVSTFKISYLTQGLWAMHIKIRNRFKSGKIKIYINQL